MKLREFSGVGRKGDFPRSFTTWETRSHHWFPLEITSEEGAQKFILMTCYYPELASASDWSCCKGNWLQPIRSCNLFLRRHFAGKTVVASQNVGCFLRLGVFQALKGVFKNWPRIGCFLRGLQRFEPCKSISTIQWTITYPLTAFFAEISIVPLKNLTINKLFQRVL